MRISVAVALPERQVIVDLDMPEGSDVSAALAAARIAERFPLLEVAACDVGIWSTPCARETLLRDGDRVEIYRPLAADAKAMRRERARITPSKRSRNAP